MRDPLTVKRHTKVNRSTFGPYKNITFTTRYDLRKQWFISPIKNWWYPNPDAQKNIWHDWFQYNVCTFDTTLESALFFHFTQLSLHFIQIISKVNYWINSAAIRIRANPHSNSAFAIVECFERLPKTFTFAI